MNNSLYIFKVVSDISLPEKVDNQLLDRLRIYAFADHLDIVAKLKVVLMHFDSLLARLLSAEPLQLGNWRQHRWICVLQKEDDHHGKAIGGKSGGVDQLVSLGPILENQGHLVKTSVILGKKVQHLAVVHTVHCVEAYVAFIKLDWFRVWVVLHLPADEFFEEGKANTKVQLYDGTSLAGNDCVL